VLFFSIGALLGLVIDVCFADVSVFSILAQLFS
jgi:hypothetical protein